MLHKKITVSSLCIYGYIVTLKNEDLDLIVYNKRNFSIMFM